jgi:hypothetical protein
LVLSQITDIEIELEEKRLKLCSELYLDLENTYGYLTSEKVIEETLIANDYKFNEFAEIV